MPALSLNFLSKRSPDDDFDGPNFGGFFYSDEGRTIRYGVLLAIILVFFAFLVIAYQHANTRMKRGLAPLPYHRWLVSRKRRAQFEPQIATQGHPRPPEENFSFYQYEEHVLHSRPPPAYNPNFVQPPAYPGPPEGATKTAPQQCPPPSYPANDSSSAPTAGPSSPAEQRS